MKCSIQWIDKNGNPTPDNNEAIGHVYREAYKHPCKDAVNGYIEYPETERYPICAEHVERLRTPGMEHWHFTEE